MSDKTDRVFHPKSIVVVGASQDPNRIGGRPLRYLRDSGYSGKVYGINPKYDEVQGYPCFARIADLPDDVDLAVLMLSSGHVLEAVRACGEKGIAGAVVTAAGFGEAGPEGRELQRQLGEIARSHGIRVIGPNTIGFRNHNSNVYATFGTDVDSGVRPGNVAVVTQSGGLGGYLGAAQLRDQGIGTRWLIDTGNEVDIDCAESVRFLAREPGISVIGLIIEGCRDSGQLLEAIAAARRAGLAVVVLKIGRSQAGARSVALHTGALSGEDRVWDAALEAAGAIRARDEPHFVELIRIFDMPKQVGGPGLGVVTLSGGVATVLLDAAERCGLEIPPISEVDAGLRERLPLVGFTNPLDASGQMANTPEDLEPLVDVMLAQEKVDVVVVWLAYALLSDVLGPAMARGVANAASRSQKPLIVCGMATPERRDELAAAGVAVMPYPTTVVETIRDRLHMPPAPEADLSARPRPTDAGKETTFTGPQAEALLPGVPFAPHRRLASREAAREAIGELGPSIVLKAEAPGLAHKSDLGLVRVGITDAGQAGEAFDELAALLKQQGIDGEIVAQKQLRGAELFLGASRDPIFGPTVTFGLGGVFVEIFKDTALLLAPCTRAQVLDALRRLDGWPVIDGARGSEKVDVEAFAELVERFSRMFADDPAMLGVDLNPIIANSEAMAAVDAVVTKTEG